jgi:hypothetical protein
LYDVEDEFRGRSEPEHLTRLRLRPTRCNEGGSGRAYDGVC